MWSLKAASTADDLYLIIFEMKVVHSEMDRPVSRVAVKVGTTAHPPGISCISVRF